MINPSGLVNFSDAKSLTPSAFNATRDIRRMISDCFMEDEFFQDLGKHLIDPGSAGNRQMDQALVAEAIFQKRPVLRGYDNLNHKKLWEHVSHVLSSYGYEMKAGRVHSHAIESSRVEHKPEDYAAPAEESEAA